MKHNNNWGKEEMEKMERKAKSGIMVILLLISMLTLALDIQLAKASGTIYIRADGSIDALTALIVNAVKTGGKIS